MDSNRLSQAIDRLTAAGSVVVLTGAGISKESGVPTFRDAQTGLWANYDPQTLATREGFSRDPSLVWRWYAWRSNLVAGVQPNPAHLAIARLATFRQVTVVTQNVDGLHQEAGSEEVLELHGNIRRYKCFASDHPLTIDDPQVEEPPPCPHCGSPARPDVVWFGEMLPAEVLDRAMEAILQCDLMLVVGTSGIVHPAAGLPLYASEAGAYTIEVNPEHTPLTPHLDLHLGGPAGQIMPALVRGVEETAGDS